jgi:hypothetical protein
MRPAGAYIVTSLCQQHGIAQRRLILDAGGLLCRYRGGDKRQSLPPGPGPALLSADHRIERAEDSACGERDVLDFFSRKALRIRDSTAQPGRHHRSRRGRGGAAERGKARR